MNKLRGKLLNAEPLDLAPLVRGAAGEVPELQPLLEMAVGETALLERTQRMLDMVRAAPPPPAECPSWPLRPWWEPMPAAYAAALLWDVGMGSIRWGGRVRAGSLPPHARESAQTARTVLQRLALPLTIREHALALILHQDKPLRSRASAETLMRLACRLDLRALWRLKGAELAAGPWAVPEERTHALEAFRSRAEELNILGCVPALPLSREEIASCGFAHPRQAHRAANALRYFRLRAGLCEPEWFRERLRWESGQVRGRLNLLVGPAGCGKSLWAARNLAGGRIISSDQMRAELTGDAADQSQNYLVFQRCMDQVRASLRRGETVTFDATNFMEALRHPVVQAARWCAAEIHTFFFDISLEQALKRNQGRARCVPEQVIRRHFRLLTPPALYEADQHWVVDVQGEARLYWPVEPAAARCETASA